MSVRKSFKFVGLPTCLVVLELISACRSDAIEISDAWVRATVPGQKVAAAYLKIKSPFNSRLVAVASEAAESVEIHSISLDGGMMQMRRLEVLELPANETIALEPAGHHLMLMGIKKPLVSGEKIPLIVSIQRSDKSKQTIPVIAEVRSGK